MSEPRPDAQPVISLGRRAFLKNGTLLLSAAAVDTSWFFRNGQELSVRVGLMTDLHYADRDPVGSRHYRQTLAKLTEAGDRLRGEQLSFLIELGDFIDAADSVETELGYLERVNRDFAAICPDRHYVLGNHCVDTLTKQEFLGVVSQSRAHYSFEAGGFHFIVLDACFRSDGESYGRKNFTWTDTNIPQAELDWLVADLQQTRKKTVVFIHQRLDVSNFYGVRNAASVRRVLEQSGDILAVLQGHSHHNDYNEINGIHYCTLVAMVEGSGPENNGYAVMSLSEDETILIEGFRRQRSYAWPG